MTFPEYYRQQFRSDIQRFMMSIPLWSRHHDIDKSDFTIQYECLTKDTKHLEVVEPADRVNFAIALFLSVLVDEVCYTHFKSIYPRFRNLTRYPKFIGGCPNACHYHLHPLDIFTAINFTAKRSIAGEQNYARRPDVSAFALLDEAIDVMKAEVFDFFTNHLPEVDPNAFWTKCADEIPTITKDDNSVAKTGVDHGDSPAAGSA